jgi:hypothetical protein
VEPTGPEPTGPTPTPTPAPVPAPTPAPPTPVDDASRPRADSVQDLVTKARAVAPHKTAAVEKRAAEADRAYLARQRDAIVAVAKVAALAPENWLDIEEQVRLTVARQQAIPVLVSLQVEGLDQGIPSRWTEDRVFAAPATAARDLAATGRLAPAVTALLGDLFASSVAYLQAMLQYAAAVATLQTALDTPPRPASSERPDKACDPPPTGRGTGPATVSDKLLDRMMGKYAVLGTPPQDVDQGEGCAEQPYVAGPGEKVCTHGYGSQIFDCPVVMKGSGVAPTPEERTEAIRNQTVAGMKCACEGDKTKTIDCKGPAAREQLTNKANGRVPTVYEKLPVELSQAELDAMVDLMLHTGDLPADLVDAVKKYWCTPQGKNYVRSMYLTEALTRPQSTVIEPNFVNRRQKRVWPISSEEQ